MRWNEFSRGISQDNYINIDSSHGSISQMISQRGRVEVVPDQPHSWYPKGILNSGDFRGHRYVDMHHSYFGRDAILVSEANCCVILLLIDTQSNTKFAAHVAACSELKSKFWLRMRFDLECFFKMIKYDLSRVECYLFSNQLYKDCAGTFEQKNIMQLLASSLTACQLREVATQTHLIEGENGGSWNHHCVVRISSQQKQFLDISFAQ